MSKRKKPKRALYYWIPVLLWAGLIFYLSGISSLSSGFSTPIEIILRKVAHAVEYGILAVLLLLLANRGYLLDLPRSFFTALLATLLYALSDELHQSFVLQRNGNLKDVAVDLAGAYIMLKAALMFIGRKLESKELGKIIAVIILFILIIFWQVWGSLEMQKEEARIQTARQSLDEKIKQQEKNSFPEKSKEPVALIEQKGEQEKEREPAEPAVVLPEKVFIDVPFSSQAPFGVWDEVHQEACEEMSLIMVKFHLDGKELSKETAEKEILELKEFQERKYGDYKDSSMEELAEIGREFYGISNFKVVYDFAKEDLKIQLARGKPVIIPTAGRMLGNPNFTAPGPLYHNLVLVGYDGDTMITNDPGTRKGEGYAYSLDVLYDAIHDFEGNKEKILQGRKAMIILE